MITKEALFSVVTPVSDDILVEKYAASVEAASGFENIEHIFVRNCASREVMSVTDNFALRHVNHVNVDTTQKGIQCSRNFGIENATGEWIINLDSDVQINRSFFDAIEAAIQENPGVEVIVPRLLRDEGDSLLERLTSAHYTLLSRRERPPINNPGLVIKRQVYDEIGGLDTRFKHGNDNDFKRKLKTRNIVNVPKAAVFHTVDCINKVVRQHYRYGCDRSRISRLSCPKERPEILNDRLRNLLFLPKFSKNMSTGVQMATYEATLGVVSAIGFWSEEVKYFFVKKCT